MDLKIEYVPIDSIKPYSKNAKLHPQEQIEQIKKSIQEFGNCDPIGIWNGEVVEGHGRLMALKEMGADVVPVIRLDHLTDEQRRAYALVHNKLTMNSPFDDGILSEELENILDIDMSMFDFSIGEDIINTPEQHGSLYDEFLFPPFSVLNARSGEWRDRKRYWINEVGIKSGETRDNLKAKVKHVGSVPRFYDFKTKCEAKLGRKLTEKEFAENYLSDYIPDDTTIKVGSGGELVSIFDPVLTELMYKWFCPSGGSILDPFAGGCVRGCVASLTGHKYTGIDIRNAQVEANKKTGAELCENNIPIWLCGDSLNINKLVNDKYDMIFSCPPYADLEVYSDLANDISNMQYEDFLKAYRQIIKNTCQQLKDDRFAVFVVGEVRDKKGKYYNFVGDTINAFLEAGMQYYNEIILATPIGSLPVRVKTSWKNRKIGKAHQNVLVFYKGNMNNIKQNFVNNTDLKNIDRFEELLDE